MSAFVGSTPFFTSFLAPSLTIPPSSSHHRLRKNSSLPPCIKSFHSFSPSPSPSHPHTRHPTPIANLVSKSSSSALTKLSARSTQNSPSTPAPPISEPSLLDQFYLHFTFFPFPLGPLLFRKTVRTEVIPNKMWIFEQQHSLFPTFVTINLRMTVIRLNDDSLWVHAPIAPTNQCMALLKQCGSGKVKHIVASTFAYEHKVFVAPWKRRFPDANLYVPEGLWSWPINLPRPFLGLFDATVLTTNPGQDLPWRNEIDFKLMGPVSIGLAPYVEAVFFHRPSKTLIVTDLVVHVSENPPSILDQKQVDISAKDTFFVERLNPDDGLKIKAGDFLLPTSKDELRLLGWMRMAIWVLFVSPKSQLYPIETFQKLANRLFVSPILRVLVFTKFKGVIRSLVQDVQRDWDFTRVIPAHFDAPVNATPADLRRAFAFAFNDESFQDQPSKDDLKALESIDQLLVDTGVVYKDAEAKI